MMKRIFVKCILPLACVLICFVLMKRISVHQILLGIDEVEEYVGEDAEYLPEGVGVETVTLQTGSEPAAAAQSAAESSAESSEAQTGGSGTEAGTADEAEEEESLYDKRLDYARIKNWKVLKSEEEPAVYRNLAITVAKTRELEGLTITTMPDGSYVLDGTYQGDQVGWIRMSPKWYKLTPGTYYFSDEGFSAAHKKCTLRFGEGYDTEEAGFKMQNVNKKSYGHRLVIGDEDYSRIWYGLRIKKGFTARNETLRFMIYRMEEASGAGSAPNPETGSDAAGAEEKLTDTSYPYEPCPVYKCDEEADFSEYGLIIMKKEEYNLLTEEERKRFYNNIRFQYIYMYDWFTIWFEDGTGITFREDEPGTGRYGTLDPAGRVLNADAVFERMLPKEI